MIINYDGYCLENMYVILMHVYTDSGKLIQHDLQQYHIANNNLLRYSLEIT